MNERQKSVLMLCDVAISSMTSSVDEIFSQELTNTVVLELGKMKASLDPEIYSPTYARFIIDSYSGKLVDQILKVDYEYSRIRKNGKLRGGAVNI